MTDRFRAIFSASSQIPNECRKGDKEANRDFAARTRNYSTYGFVVGIKEKLLGSVLSFFQNQYKGIFKQTNRSSVRSIELDYRPFGIRTSDCV